MTRRAGLGALALAALLVPVGLAGRGVAESLARTPAAGTLTPIPLQGVAATATSVPPSIAPTQAAPAATDTPMPPTPTPAPVSFGAFDHAIIYDNGSQIILLPTSGTGRVGLAFISASPYEFKKPRVTGYQYIYYDNGFFLGDIYGHHSPIVPPLGPGESVYDAWPSPGGQYIAWQMVSRGVVAGLNIDMAASRIVISDPTGGNARTLLQQNLDPSGDDIPIIYGWRTGNPPTLLVQNAYADPAILGMHRGLEEFDPTIDDLVGDYLPPLGQETQPTGEVLGVSPSGQSIVYATRDAHLPSGEGPYPVAISAMTLSGRHVSAIDTAGAHHDKGTKKLPAPRAAIFYRGAYISPDDTRLAYTRLDVIYRKGSIIPYIRPIACLANLDGTGKVDFGPDERVMGWIDAQTVLVRMEDTHKNGLYAVNLTSGATKLLVLGNDLQVDGIIP